MFPFASSSSLSCELDLTECSHILGRVRVTPVPIQHLVFNGSPWNPDAPSPVFQLLWLTLCYFGGKRNPAPCDFSKGSLEVYTFLLGSTSSREQWNLLRLIRDGCFLCFCWYVHLSCISPSPLITNQMSRSASVPEAVASPASAELHVALRSLGSCSSAAGNIFSCTMTWGSRGHTVKMNSDFCTKTCKDWRLYLDADPFQSGSLKQQKR